MNMSNQCVVGASKLALMVFFEFFEDVGSVSKILQTAEFPPLIENPSQNPRLFRAENFIDPLPERVSLYQSCQPDALGIRQIVLVIRPFLRTMLCDPINANHLMSLRL
jgi:hypothetical protein